MASERHGSESETVSESLLVAVCAGGASRRMGRDKARIRVDGVALLERAVMAAAACGVEVWVVGRDRPADWHGPDVRFLVDDAPGSGPAGALQTAMSRTSRDVALVACDLPEVTAAAVRWLLDTRRGADDAVVAEVDGRVQPLFAVYGRACEPVLRERLDAGRRSLVGLLDAVRTRRVVVPDVLRAALRDADTPGDLGLE